MPAGASAPAKTDDGPAGDAKGGPVEVTGRVVGPDGKPVAGAIVAVWTKATKKDTPPDRVKTGEDGRFRLDWREFDGPAVRLVAPTLDPSWSSEESRGEALLAPFAVPDAGSIT